MIKLAISVVIEDDSGRFVFVKRPLSKKEFPGFWSLPTVSKDVGHDQGLDSSNEELEAIMKAHFPDINYQHPILIVRRAWRNREGYQLHMILIHNRRDSIPTSISSCYEECCFDSFENIMTKASYQFGW